MKNKNPNPKKFGKDRSVDLSWEKVPMQYTGIRHPQNKDKELVIKEFLGDKAEVCWRNNRLSKMGIGQLVPLTKEGFLFRGKEVKFKNGNWVW